MNTYGIHSIHGRAPAVATGIALARPDLDVWVVTGDGDGLSIGGNHLIHALRRNVNMTILLFNNQIYGLTKGQYSPTSEVGKVTKSSPFGSLDHPFNPISVAIGAEASFVARTHDMDRKHMQKVFRRAHEHRGAAFVEIYQNCNVFNDGAFEHITSRDKRAEMLVELEHGEPIRFGADKEHGVRLNKYGEAEMVNVADVGEGAVLVHDEAPPRPDGRVRVVPPRRGADRARRRSGCSGPSSARATRPRCRASSARRRQHAAPATSARSSSRARSGTSPDLPVRLGPRPMSEQPIPGTAVAGYVGAVLVLVLGGWALGAVSKPVPVPRSLPRVEVPRPSGDVPVPATP